MKSSGSKIMPINGPHGGEMAKFPYGTDAHSKGTPSNERHVPQAHNDGASIGTSKGNAGANAKYYGGK